MTDKQPEAMRLADWHKAMADEPNRNESKRDKHRRTEAELRRLHEVNAELVGALKDILSWEENEEMTWYPKARAALAKATGEQQ
jgi:hypothetical protein